MDEDKFWMWLIGNGYHDEDYILDNLAELEEMYEDEQDDVWTTISSRSNGWTQAARAS